MTTMIMSAAAVITTTKHILHPAGSPVGCFLYYNALFLGNFFPFPLSFPQLFMVY